jgi:hypothetical protein
MHGYNLQMALGPDVRVDTLAIVSPCVCTMYNVRYIYVYIYRLRRVGGGEWVKWMGIGVCRHARHRKSVLKWMGEGGMN